MSYAARGRVERLTPFGTATDAGRELLDAIASASSGDVIQLGAGTYDCGVSQIIVPSGVTVSGVGKGISVVKTAWKTIPPEVGASGLYNSMFMGDGSSLENLSLYFVPATAVLGLGLSPQTNASISLRNIEIVGDSDCIYPGISKENDVWVGTDSTIIATGCDFYSLLDTYNTGASGQTVTFTDCTFSVGEAARAKVGTSHYASGGLIRCIENPDNMVNVIKCFGCRFTLEKPVADAQQGFCVENSEATATVELHDCTLSTLSLGGSSIDLKVATGCTILTNRCHGSGPNGALTLAASTAAIVPSVTSVDVADPASLGSESLTNGTFTGNATSWAAAGDIAYGTNNCVYTDSTHSGSLTQASADLATALIGSAWYKLTYKITAAEGSPAATITTGILDAAKVIDVATNCNLRVVYFKTKASPGDFVLAFTSAAGDTFTIDSISLKRLTGGNILAAGTISATGGLIVPTAANDAGAAALGIGVGGLYAITGTGVVMRRAT